jgi:hypothetical protein
MTFRFLNWATYKISLRTGKDTESQSKKSRSILSKATALYRRHLGLPATFGYSHQQAKGWFTVPTRIQALTVWLWICLNVVACGQHYIAIDNNL